MTKVNWKDSEHPLEDRFDQLQKEIVLQISKATSINKAKVINLQKEKARQLQLERLISRLENRKTELTINQLDHLNVLINRLHAMHVKEMH